MEGDDVLFSVRRAQVEDAPAIAWHRARMFQDMGMVSPVTFDAYQPEVIAGGAGVQLRQVPPHPFRPAREGAVAKGKHAIVLNVFTEPEWRRRGLAKLLMEEIFRWAGAERLDQLVLHASDEARRLYEQMGFVATNEMRFEGGQEVPQS